MAAVYGLVTVWNAHPFSLPLRQKDRPATKVAKAATARLFPALLHGEALLSLDDWTEAASRRKGF